MVIVTQSLGGIILGRARTIPESHLIAKLIGDESMNLHAEVKACADTRRNGIQRVRKNGLCRQRSGQAGEECLSQGRQIGMSKGCLELTHPEAQFRTGSIVDPCLLQDVAT